MPAPLIPFKAGFVLLLGIVSAPVLKPLLDKTIKTSVKVGMRVKKGISDATAEVKTFTAEVTREAPTAESDAADAPVLAPQH